MKISLFSFLIVASPICFVDAGYSEKVLLISMDGFRHDYLHRVQHKPNFDRMVREGVKAPFINNAFTTSTFPTHFTMVTGLYEETHGIVGNFFYDPVLNDTFHMKSGSTESKWWMGGEPIWITARKQGKSSATYFFPGSEVDHVGIRPNFWKPYKKSTVFRDRVDTVVDWFTNKSVDIATLYFFEPDSTGHEYGPDSDQVLSKIEDLDAVLGYLFDEFEKKNLMDHINIILTSDHGMTSLDPVNHVIAISNYLNQSGSMWDLVEQIPARGAICHVIPKEGKTQQVYNLLKTAHTNMTVYLKKDIPERLHYKLNERIPPILIIADEGWTVTDFAEEDFQKRGGHGYDNQLPSMKPFFLARGPNFKTNFKTKPFDSVDIYPLMCELLGLTPAPHNGSLSVVKTFVRETSEKTPTTPSTNDAKGVSLAHFWFIFIVLNTVYLLRSN